MLWYKNWLETRYRFLWGSGMLLFFVVFNFFALGTAPGLQVQILFANQGIYWLVLPLLLAGTGVMTQSTFRPARGLHGSTLFTLSLPVTRLRLLAVRSGLGILEIFGAIALMYGAAWTAFCFLRTDWPLLDSLEYVLTVFACLSAFYFLFMVLAALLPDDMTRNWVCIATVVLFRLMTGVVHVPPALNVFQAMGASSPLVTHTLPSATLAGSIIASVLFFWIALKIVEATEY
jgi:hypothetical protein